MKIFHKHLPEKYTESGSRIHTKCRLSVRHPILAHACHWLILTMLANQAAAADPDSTNWIGLCENQ